MSAAALNPVPDDLPFPTRELVTPALALLWLASIAGQRGLSRVRVEQYARDMKAGRWFVNGNCVVFDRNGHLVDGQHRLHAVVAAGVSVWMLVLRDVDPGAMPSIDAGRSRTYADVLAIRGEINRTMTSAVATWLYRWERDDMLSTSPISNAERDEVIARHPLVREAASEGTKLPVGVKSAPVVFVYTVALERDPAMAGVFFQYLQTGVGFPSTRHPIYRLRERLMSSRKTMRLRPVEACAITIKAWNALRQHRLEIGALIWRPVGPTAEPFPKLI